MVTITTGLSLRIDEETYKRFKILGVSVKQVFEWGLKYNELTDRLERMEMERNTQQVLIERLQRTNAILQEQLLQYTDREKEEKRDGDRNTK